MKKTINITALTYNSEAGRFAEYGFEDLYVASSNKAMETCVIDDASICPPLYDKSEFETNIDYKARIVSIDENNSWVNVIVNGEIGVIYFDHLTNYWGSIDCVRENYKKDDEIDVRFSVMKKALRVFKEKGVRHVAFTDFTYQVGDTVDIHIGPIDANRSFVWFNGRATEILPKYDELFKNRVRNRVYYPGCPVKAEVTMVDDCKPGVRFYRFSVKHEKVDYGLPAGDYPCLIGEIYGKKYVYIKTDKGILSIECPQADFPKDFPSLPTGKFPAVVRVCGCDELGEPQIEIKSLLKERFSLNEGKTFDIKLVRPLDPHSRFRIWPGPDGMFGMVAKSAVTALGNIQNGLDGHIINGKIYVTRKGESLHHVHVGDIENVTVEERFSQYFATTIHYKRAFVFNVSNLDETVESADVKIVHVDESSNLIMCVPAHNPAPAFDGYEVGSKISLQILMIGHDHVILGNGVNLGIMNKTDWDWCDGKTLTQFAHNSLYINVLVKDITEDGILVLERKSLIENPWTKIGLLKNQIIDAKVENISKSSVTVSVDGIYTEVKWSSFCQYQYNFGKYLYEEGDIVRLSIKYVDVENRVLVLKYPFEDSINQKIYFDKSIDHSATIVKLVTDGVLIQINGVYALIPHTQMLAESEYVVDKSINVRFIKKMFNEEGYYFEFSHIAGIDTSDILQTGKVFNNAVFEKLDGNDMVFSSSGLKMYCRKDLAKYFSAERELNFADNMVPGQTFNLRITNTKLKRAVPESMPDYSGIQLHKKYPAKIYEILNDGYLLSIEELNDVFYLPFGPCCDWNECHFETRSVGDDVIVSMQFYSYTTNLPRFSMIAGLEDPWAGLSEGDTIDVPPLGSLEKKNDIYVDVKGVPVKLGTNAICNLIEMPWVGETVQYSTFKDLLNRPSFKMDIISIDLDKHNMELMPHYPECPKIVNRAQVIYNRAKSEFIWVKCENGIIGCLPKSEVPEGYEVKTIIPQAACRSFNYENGYAILSIKDLFVTHDGEMSAETEVTELKGISVTEETVLKENMIVRGRVGKVQSEKKRFPVQVGPCRGLITYHELTHMISDAPMNALVTGEEYDFYISAIDVERNNLLYLTRKPFAPMPPDNIRIGEKVHAKVCRYDSTSEIIVATLDEYNGLEAIISPSDLAGCKIGNKTRFPKRGFKFTANIESVSRKATGTINRIKLVKGI